MDRTKAESEGQALFCAGRLAETGRESVAHFKLPISMSRIGSVAAAKLRTGSRTSLPPKYFGGDGDANHEYDYQPGDIAPVRQPRFTFPDALKQRHGVG